MMHKIPGFHLVSMVVWFLTSVGAINWGLKPLGYNLIDHVEKFAPALVNPAYYLIGVAGVISLIMFFAAVADPKCKC